MKRLLLYFVFLIVYSLVCFLLISTKSAEANTFQQYGEANAERRIHQTPEELLNILPPAEYLYIPDSYVIYDRYYFPLNSRAVARTWPRWLTLGPTCIIHMNPALENSWAYWFILVHEWGHCNGWQGWHPRAGESNLTVETFLDMFLTEFQHPNNRR